MVIKLIHSIHHLPHYNAKPSLLKLDTHGFGLSSSQFSDLITFSLLLIFPFLTSLVSCPVFVFYIVLLSPLSSSNTRDLFMVVCPFTGCEQLVAMCLVSSYSPNLGSNLFLSFLRMNPVRLQLPGSLLGCKIWDQMVYMVLWGHGALSS